MSPLIYISSGEASGDMHGANLARELHRLAPGARIIGMGGEKMRRAGVDVRVDIQDLGITGILEVIVRFPRLIKAYRCVRDILRNEKPDLVVLIDAPELNMRLANHAKALGIPMVYYIGPQVWAWRQSRVKDLARTVGRMLVILPFEKEFYESRGMDVEFVGHPLLDEPMPSVSNIQARQTLGMDPGEKCISLLPGSRSNEIQHMGDLLCETAAKIHDREPQVKFLLPLAPTINRAFASKVVGRSTVPVQMVTDRTYEALLASELAIAAAGTVTLEVALLNVPLIVLYRTSKISSFFVQKLVKVDHISLVNLIAGRRLVPEFVQDEATPQRLADEAVKMLRTQELLTQAREDLSKIRRLLGEPGASHRAAKSIIGFLEKEKGSVASPASGVLPDGSSAN